jgi:hypothetical protein
VAIDDQPRDPPGATGKIRSRRRWYLGVAVLAGLVIPASAASLLSAASAAGASVDTTSDHVALHAYGHFAQAVLSGIPAGRRADNAFLSDTRRRCAHALAPIDRLRISPNHLGPALAFGEEIGADLTVVGNLADRRAVAKLAAAISDLPWSSPSTSATVKGYLTAQRKLVGLRPSDVCTDVRALVRSRAKVEPPGTRRWLADFRRAVSTQQARLSAFQTILEHFHSPSDSASLRAVKGLVQRADQAVKRLAMAEGETLVSTLE